MVQPHEQQAIRVPEPYSRLGLAAQDDQLLTQDNVFGLNSRPRLEPGAQDQQKPVQERDHRAFQYHTSAAASLRRRFSVGTPDLTVTLGTPNACNGCHRNSDAKWADGWVERWYGHRPQGFQRYTETFAYSERGTAEAGPSLARIAVDSAHPAIARASALEALTRYPRRATVDAARAGLSDGDALVRRAAVGTLTLLPPKQRLPLVAPLLNDPVRTVRMEAASALADAMGAATPAQRAAFDRAAAEYEAAQRFNSDRPEARAALGSFYARQSRFNDAQAQLQSATALDPAFVPAYVNLVDLLRLQGRDADGERVLREALQKVPDAAPLHHTLGLTLIRLRRNAEALAELQRAAKLAPSDTRFAYVCAVGLHAAGDTKAAFTEIDRALARHPDDRELLVAAATLRRESGDIKGARRYAQRLSQRYPDDQGASRLASELGAAR